MIIPERKRAVTAILSKMKPEKLSMGGEVGKQPAPDMEAKHAHMQRMIESIKNEDHVGAVEHMNNFLEEHQLHQQKEDEPSDYKPEE